MRSEEPALDLFDAREALGLGCDASFDDIRTAWKRMAFATHPDRNGGARSAFDRASAAYALLLGEQPGAPVKPATRWTSAQRPIVEVRVEQLDHKVVVECQKALERRTHPGALPRCRIIKLDPAEGNEPAAGRTASRHVPTAIKRKGRNLTFMVASDLAQGTNLVALPGALLQDSRKVAPVIVAFTSDQSESGVVTIPVNLVQDVISGARSVSIRFGASTQDGDPWDQRS